MSPQYCLTFSPVNQCLQAQPLRSFHPQDAAVGKRILLTGCTGISMGLTPPVLTHKINKEMEGKPFETPKLHFSTSGTI